MTLATADDADNTDGTATIRVSTPDISDKDVIVTEQDDDPTGPCTDADSDGYYLEGDCGTAQDCNDTDGSVNPGATEICNYVDDNCDGQQGENAEETYYQDADGDGYGNPDETILACPAPGGMYQISRLR